MKSICRLLLLSVLINCLSCAGKPTPPPITKTEAELLYNAGEAQRLIVKQGKLFIQRKDSDLKIPVMLREEENPNSVARELLINRPMKV